jgi:hypothetical protein
MARRQPQNRGRKAGSRNNGYWFRKGRGWYVTEGDSKVPLCGKDGSHIKDEETTTETLKDVYAAHVCWRHYAKWCGACVDPVWEALE